MGDYRGSGFFMSVVCIMETMIIFSAASGPEEFILQLMRDNIPTISIFLVALVVGGFIANRFNKTDRRIEKTEVAIVDLQNRMAKVEDRLDAVEIRLAVVETKLDMLNDKVDKLSNKLDRLVEALLIKNNKAV